MGKPSQGYLGYSVCVCVGGVTFSPKIVLTLCIIFFNLPQGDSGGYTYSHQSLANEAKFS